MLKVKYSQSHFAGPRQIIAKLGRICPVGYNESGSIFSSGDFNKNQWVNKQRSKKPFHTSYKGFYVVRPLELLIGYTDDSFQMGHTSGKFLIGRKRRQSEMAEQLMCAFYANFAHFSNWLDNWVLHKWPLSPWDSAVLNVSIVLCNYE